jgi:hypothetical protein
MWIVAKAARARGTGAAERLQPDIVFVAGDLRP